MMDSKVGIVLLNWNGYLDTIECIESINSLQYKNFRIYIVDNNSTDNSVREIKRKFGNSVEIIENDFNSGFSSGNNLGILAALREGADYIWLLNNDTTVSVLSLTTLLRKMQSNYNIGLLGSVLYEYSMPWQIQAWGGGKFNGFLGTTSAAEHPVESVDHIIGASMFFSRKCLEKCGLLDERFFFYLEDTEISLRVRDNGFTIGVAEDSFVFHKGGSSTNENKQSKSLKVDIFYANSVGLFMRIRKFPLISVAARLILMVMSRIIRKEYGRVPSIVSNFIRSYTSNVK